MDKISYICSFLLAIIFVSCQKEETSYYISDLRVQRIEMKIRYPMIRYIICWIFPWAIILSGR